MASPNNPSRAVQCASQLFGCQFLTVGGHCLRRGIHRNGAMFMFEPGYVEEIDPNKKPKTDADAPVLFTPTANPEHETADTRPVGRPKPPDDDEELAAFEACTRKIIEDFGHVHDNLGLNQKDPRGLCATGPIKNGDIILGIAECACITAASALKDERFGPFVDEHTASGPTRDDETGDEKKGKVKGKTTKYLRMPRGDVALAMKVTIDALHMRSTIQYSTWAPYHWLLDREDFDESPTWWDDTTRVKLLRGSHVLDMARKAEKDFENDWDVVKDELAEIAVDERLFPSVPMDFLREVFRRAVAAIHSRSFNTSMPGEEACDAAQESERTVLVPVLDCANHHRQPRECQWQMNPIHHWEDRRVDIGKWSIVVGALKDFNAGDPVRIAYGARGNSELLVRYGFTVEDNAEPDGSSNDVVPLHIPGVSHPVAQLRVASRPGYTYPPLAAALDAIKRKRLGIDEPDPGDAKKTRDRTDDEIVGELDELDDWYGGGAGGADDEDDDAALAEMYGDGGGVDGEDDDAAGGVETDPAEETEQENAVDAVEGMRLMDDPYGGGRSPLMDDEDADGADDAGVTAAEGGGSLDVEVDALRDLVAILTERRDAIPEELTLEPRADQVADARAATCAVQMLSERMTLSFYLAATKRALAIGERVVDGTHVSVKEAVAAELGEVVPEIGDEPPAGVEGRQAMAWRVGDAHVETLIRAYFRIRHGAA